MNEYSTHYRIETMTGHNLNNFAKWAEGIILKKIPKDKTIVLMYRGMSGISLSTAILSRICRLTKHRNIGMVYVRKEKEWCHSSAPTTAAWTYEANDLNEVNAPSKLFVVFVDDFIQLGTTFEATRAATAKALNVKIVADNCICICSGDNAGGTHTSKVDKEVFKVYGFN